MTPRSPGKGWLIFQTVMVVYSLGLTLWGYLLHSWFLLIAGGFLVGFNTMVDYHGLRRYRANRRADRNSGSTRPNLHSGITTRYPSGIYPRSSSSIGAIQGTSPSVREEPFKAWKWAYVEPGISEFSPVTTAPSYSVEDVAQCKFREYHRAPDFSCTCGFYGLIDRQQVISLGQFYQTYSNSERLQVLLEVEFYGRVIVHTEGYRAEKIRVLGMHIPPTVNSKSWMKRFKQYLPPTEWRWLERTDVPWL